MSKLLSHIKLPGEDEYREIADEKARFDIEHYEPLSILWAGSHPYNAVFYASDLPVTGYNFYIMVTNNNTGNAKIVVYKRSNSFSFTYFVNIGTDEMMKVDVFGTVSWNPGLKLTPVCAMYTDKNGNTGIYNGTVVPTVALIYGMN